MRMVCPIRAPSKHSNPRRPDQSRSRQGPDGLIYYVNLNGEVRRIRYLPDNQPPIASVVASTTAGPSPLIVNFDGGGSVDPDGFPLTYAWDLDNDGAFDDGSASSASFTYTTSGQHQARLRVTDVGNESNTASVTIQVDNSYPSVQITSPGVRHDLGGRGHHHVLGIGHRCAGRESVEHARLGSHPVPLCRRDLPQTSDHRLGQRGGRLVRGSRSRIPVLPSAGRDRHR